MKKLSFSLPIIFSLVIMLSACGSEDSDADDIFDDIDDLKGTPGSITARVNGNSFGSSGLFVTAAVSETTNGGYFIAVGGARLQNGINSGIVIGLVGTDFASLQANDRFSGANSENLMIASYTQEISDDEDIDAEAELNANTVCIITKIDRANRLISGTFSFNAIDDDTNERFEVREGVFTDIQYQE